MPATPTTTAADKVAFRPVTTETWPDLERLFLAPGGPKHCWCMVFRATSAERKGWTAASARVETPGTLSPANQLRRAALRRRVDAGEPVGLVGSVGEVPVAWVSIAPRRTYLRLGGPDDFADAPDAVWSLACLFALRAHRGAGLAHRMIAAAVDYARSGGAGIVEAYPVQPDSPSFRFMGFVDAFRGAGFAEIGPAGTRRTVMRLTL